MPWPSRVILPAVTGSSAVIKRARVDFPQPDSPTRPSVSPRRISRSTPSTARTARPPSPEIGKCLYAFWTRSRTGSAVTEVAGAFSAACNRAHLRRSLGLELLRRVERERAGLGRRDVLVLDVAHQHPAASDLVGPHLAQPRLIGLAAVDHEWTPRVELAAGRWVGQVRRQAVNRYQAVLAGLVDARHGSQQGPGVGVLRALEDLLDGTFLDDPARVHHDHAPAHAPASAARPLGSWPG